MVSHWTVSAKAAAERSCHRQRNEKGNVATIKAIIILTCGIERARVDLCIRKMHLHARLLTCASLFCRRAYAGTTIETHTRSRWKWVNKNSFHVIPRVKRACGGRVFSLCAEHCARMNKNNLRERQMHPNIRKGVCFGPHLTPIMTSTRQTARRQI